VPGSDLTAALLRRVSRSFYLSLAVLPRAVRPTIGLAYLFARASDTIADTRLIDRASRIAHLEALRAPQAGGAISTDVGATPATQALPCLL
jgi:farnesyl-diphosphate farnesyltransferase